MTVAESPRAAFLRLICERPEDDAPRLVYADWLEERGEVARAEFIRVQCILDRCPLCARIKGRGCINHGRLPFRERALLAAHGVRWLREEFYPVSPDGRLEKAATFVGGFVGRVELHGAAWWGGVCNYCEWQPYRTPCPRCYGSGRMNALGPHLVAAAPITEVSMTDRRASRMDDDRVLWYNARSSASSNAPWEDTIAAVVFPFLSGGELLGTDVRAYDSTAEANLDLSTAALRWARSAAAVQVINTFPEGNR